jgi:hypothetical protein
VACVVLEFRAEFDNSHDIPVALTKGEYAISAFGLDCNDPIVATSEGLNKRCPDDRLLAKVAQRIDDADVMHLLKIMLKASGKKGVPQGGVITPRTQKVTSPLSG